MAARRPASPDLHGAYPIGHECPQASALEPGVHHVPCWSGYHRDVEIPSLRQWIRFGVIPNPLMAIAIQAEWEDFKPEALDEQARNEWLDMQDFTVAEMCRPKLPLEFVKGWRNAGTENEPKWEEVRPQLPREDREMLVGVAAGTVPVGERAALLEVMSRFRSVLERDQLPRNGSGDGAAPAKAAGAR